MNNLHFEFLADKENNTLTIAREFAANRQFVWDCYTQAELLSQWFAPQPFTTKTKSMDFQNGGHWHYAMVAPEGEEYWGYTQYIDIKAIDSYSSTDVFCDAEGNVNADLPQAQWLVQFADKGAHTVVTTLIQYASLNDLETIISMGMQEGIMATWEKLDELLGARAIA